MHKTFTCIKIPKNTRNTDSSLGSSTKLLLPSWLLGFQQEEKETQFLLFWLFHLPRQRAAPSSQTITGLATLRSKNQLAPSKFKSQLFWTARPRVWISTWFVQSQISTNCFFQKYPRIPAYRFQAWRHSHTQSDFLSGVFIMTSVIVTSSTHEREYLHSMCAPN